MKELAHIRICENDEQLVALMMPTHFFDETSQYFQIQVLFLSDDGTMAQIEKSPPFPLSTAQNILDAVKVLPARTPAALVIELRRTLFQTNNLQGVH